MKLYKVVHNDAHNVTWAGTQAEAKNYQQQHNGSVAQVEIPMMKINFIKWLNDNCNKVNQ